MVVVAVGVVVVEKVGALGVWVVLVKVVEVGAVVGVEVEVAEVRVVVVKVVEVGVMVIGVVGGTVVWVVEEMVVVVVIEVVGLGIVVAVVSVFFRHLPYLAHIGARFFGVRHSVGWGGLEEVEALLVSVSDVISAAVVGVVGEASLRLCLAKYFANASGASVSVVVEVGVVGESCVWKPAYSSLLAWISRVSTTGWRSG